MDELAESTRVAREEKTTLRALVEEGSRRILEERKHQRSFLLRDVSIGEGGLQPEFETTGWDRIREVIYEGPLS